MNILPVIILIIYVLACFYPHIRLLTPVRPIPQGCEGKFFLSSPLDEAVGDPIL